MSPARGGLGARWRHLVGARGRTILQTGAWSLVARACGAANLFVSVPFVLEALGTARFGVWATLTALTALAGFLDFGFGNGAMNLIAAARGRNAVAEYPTILAAARRAVLGAALGIAPFALLAWLVLPWDPLLGLPPAFAGEGRQAAAIVLGAIVLTIPLALATRLNLGLGRGERAYRWQALASLLALASVVALARAGASLPALTAAAVGIPLLGLLVTTLELHRGVGRQAVARERVPALVRETRRAGLQFFVLQSSAVLSFSVDLLLLTALLGPDESARYAIVQRLFSIVPMALSLLWVPLWPIYREALAAGDVAWATRTFRRSLGGATLLAGSIAFGLAIGFPTVAQAWIGAPMIASAWLLAGFVACCIVEAVGNAVATFLNAAGIMRPQLVVALVFVAVCLPAKVWAAATFGPDGVVWVTAVLGVGLNLVPLWLLRHRLASDVFSITGTRL